MLIESYLFNNLIEKMAFVLTYVKIKKVTEPSNALENLNDKSNSYTIDKLHINFIKLLNLINILDFVY